MNTGTKRRGNAIVVGLMLTTLLGFGALSVDLGVIRVAHTQLQAGVDAAALSGVAYLDGTPDGITEAVTQTQVVAGRNNVFGVAISLPATDVIPGNVDDNGVFTASTDPDLVNAIRVIHDAPDAATALGTAAFGVTGYDVSATSTAVRRWQNEPASSTSCFLPFAIPDCHLAGIPPGTNPGPMVFSFVPTPTDSIGWGLPTSNPNTSEINDQITGSCAQGEIEIGDPIQVSEGQNNGSVGLIEDILNNQAGIAPDTWDTAALGPIPARSSHPTHPGSSVLPINYGNVIQGPVAFVDGGDDCSNVDFTHSKIMTGVAWAIIYDVEDTGGNKHLKFQLDFVNPHDIWGETDPDAVGPNVFGASPPSLIGG